MFLKNNKKHEKIIIKTLASLITICRLNFCNKPTVPLLLLILFSCNKVLTNCLKYRKLRKLPQTVKMHGNSAMNEGISANVTETDWFNFACY